MTGPAMTVENSIEEWLFYRRNQGRSDSTLEVYRWGGRLFLDFMRARVPDREPTLSDVDRSALLAFGGYLRQRTITTPLAPRRRGRPLSAGAQSNVMRSVANMVNWCEAQGELPGPNPFRAGQGLMPRVPRSPREIPHEEAIIALLAAANKGVDALARRGRAMLWLMLDTGLRVSELHKLDADDYDRVAGRISVRDSKGGHSRFVYPGGECRNALDEYLRRPRRALLAYRFPSERRAAMEDHRLAVHGERPPRFNPISGAEREPALFVDRRGQRMTIGAIRQWLDELCRRAGVAKFTPHQIRHLYATRAARTMQPMHLQRALGHSSIVTTMRYIQSDEEALRTSMRAASPLDAVLRHR